MALFIASGKGIHQAESLDGLHILENLLVEGDVAAGKLLVLLLILPHLDDVVAGYQERNRRAAEGNCRHHRVILHHHHERPAEADQHRTEARDEGEDVVDDHHHVAV